MLREIFANFNEKRAEKAKALKVTAIDNFCGEVLQLVSAATNQNRQGEITYGGEAEHCYHLCFGWHSKQEPELVSNCFDDIKSGNPVALKDALESKKFKEIIDLCEKNDYRVSFIPSSVVPAADAGLCVGMDAYLLPSQMVVSFGATAHFKDSEPLLAALGSALKPRAASALKL